MDNRKIIAVLGLGYVGLPLAVEFSKKFKTYGFDISNERINELKKFIDKTNEVCNKQLKSVISLTNSNKGLNLTSEINELSSANIYIITVPTPVDESKIPNLKPLLKATKMVGEILSKDDIVIFESTVYPGTTEEKCVPVLEKHSKMKFNKDFFVGYSPERMVPGDKTKSFSKIKKVTSGSTRDVAVIIDKLYSSVVTAGTFLASNIKVAEAAKVIENSQRDINIAFVNELAKIFNLMDISTTEVLEAASTKWNFLNFQPGLVGGHCIGVDPYYLAYKAQELGYHPEIILSGRRINDSMGKYVASQVVKLLIKKDIKVRDSKILVLGVTFKENCSDYRNTKIIDIVDELIQYKADTMIYDPIVDIDDFEKEYNFKITKKVPDKKFDAVIIAVPHRNFLDLDIKKFMKKKSVLFDVKDFLKLGFVDGKL